MWYFPEDIPFMSDDELIENGLKPRKDRSEGGLKEKETAKKMPTIIEAEEEK